MSYSKTWHRDYAAESVKRHELSKWAKDANLEWTEYAIECAQVAQLSMQVGEEIADSKTVDIATTVLDIIAADVAGGNRRGRTYRKITQPQRHALAVALLEKFGTARAIAAQIWQLSDAEINEADA